MSPVVPKNLIGGRGTLAFFGRCWLVSLTCVLSSFFPFFPWDTAPSYLIRDRDSAYGTVVSARIEALGIKEVVTAPRSPWQNPFVERVIGSIKRECLDYVIVLNDPPAENYLFRISIIIHRHQTHLSEGKDTPAVRSVQVGGTGKTVAFLQVGGLHHRYERLAA